MSPATIYVIDDELCVRKALGRLLRAHSYAVRTYASVDDFLAQGEECESACVLADLRMPEKTGLDLLQALNTRGVALPVILITGHGDRPMVDRALNAGARQVLLKPFDDITLLTAIEDVLQRDAHARPAWRNLPS